jgi:MtN3 and saliva related transmembrane protein
MNGLLVDTIGMAGAVLTTVCWLPQAIKIVRSRDTAAISLPGTLAFTLGIVFWLIYGLALMDWPLITSDVVTLALMSVIATGEVPALLVPHRFGSESVSVAQPAARIPPWRQVAG